MLEEDSVEADQRIAAIEVLERETERELNVHYAMWDRRFRLSIFPAIRCRP
jgi:hypothetical protein